MKYTDIINGNYPSKFERAIEPDASVEERFLKATKGWMKYKPLLMYITQRENYDKIIEETRQKLIDSVPKMNKIFKTCDFTCLIDILDKYNENIERHYNEYLHSYEAWNKLKNVIKDGI